MKNYIIERLGTVKSNEETQIITIEDVLNQAITSRSKIENV